MEKLIKSADTLYKIFNEIKDKKINEKSLMENFENEVQNILELSEKIKGMMKLNNDEFEDLNSSSKILEKEISDFSSSFNKFYEIYKLSVKEILNEFFAIKKIIFSV